MTLYLYYSIANNMTPEEVIEIDKQVIKNQKIVNSCLKNIISKTRIQTVMFIIILAGLLNIQQTTSEAIGLPIPPSRVVRVNKLYDYNSLLQVQRTIPRKNIQISYSQTQKVLFLVYLSDSRLSENQEILNIVKKLRGGSWELIGTVTFLALLIFLMSQGLSLIHI